jgi:hypothetical protein
VPHGVSAALSAPDASQFVILHLSGTKRKYVDLRRAPPVCRRESRGFRTCGRVEGSQFNWRPDAHSWSMAECLLHLNMVGDRCVHVLETILADARARANWDMDPSDMAGWGSGLSPAPSRRPSTNPRRPVRAANFQAPAGAIVAATGTGQRLGSRAYQGAGARGAAARIQSRAHERRHLWQARQVRNHAAFPVLGSTWLRSGSDRAASLP